MKQYCVRGPNGQWLHALDPCEPGKARFVRSKWVADRAQATVFDSRGYAEAVAQNAPYLWTVVRNEPP